MSATSRPGKAAVQQPEQAPPAPPYYIAEQPLFLGDQFSRAHNAGDRVPPEHVTQFGWQDKVRLPDGYAATPDQPTSEPETTTGQATSSKEGDL